MSIADGDGNVYTIQKPEELLKTIDKDSMLSVLQTTYVAKCTNENISAMIKMGLIERVNGDANEDVFATSLGEGVEFLKAHLIEVFNIETVEAAIKEAHENIYGSNESEK